MRGGGQGTSLAIASHPRARRGIKMERGVEGKIQQWIDPADTDCPFLSLPSIRRPTGLRAIDEFGQIFRKK